jgi:hypothetical protein
MVNARLGNSLVFRQLDELLFLLALSRRHGCIIDTD